jgi:membrane protease YdiL (CAAX protease family)
MPLTPSSAISSVLALVVLLGMAGMFTAWIWLIVRLREGSPVLPQAPESAPAPWGWRTVFLVLAASFLVSVLATRGYSRLRKDFGVSPPRGVAPSGAPAERSTPATSPAQEPGEKGPDLTFAEQMFVMASINGALIVLVPLVLRWSSGARLAQLGVTRDGAGRDVLLGTLSFLLAWPVVMVINYAADTLWRTVAGNNPHPLLRMLLDGFTISDVYLAYVSAVILAPIAEELLFRGVLQSWLRRLVLDPPRPARSYRPLPDDGRGFGDTPERGSEGGAVSPQLPPEPGGTGRRGAARRYLPVLLSSGIFAAMHAPQMPAPIALFFLALVLGGLYERTGRLLPSIVLHALFNGFNTTLLVLALLNPQLNTRGLEGGSPSPGNKGRHGQEKEKITFPLAPPRAADRVLLVPGSGSGGGRREGSLTSSTGRRRKTGSPTTTEAGQ